MSSAAAAVGGAPSSADDRVYRAVAAGESVEEVRRAIESSPTAAAAVNQTGANGETPLRAAARLGRGDLVCHLLENGAEGAGGITWFWAVSWCVRDNDFAKLRWLIERGVSVDTDDGHGYKPLMSACFHSGGTADRRDLTLEIFRLSSAETRRAVSNSGRSAVDWFVSLGSGLEWPWHAELIVELLAAGCPVRRENAALVMPIAAAHAALREAELAACLTMGHDWRAQETFADLSMDMGELREAEREVLERRARLEALERELGGESESDSSGSESNSSGSERESASDHESEREATGSGGSTE